MKKIIINLALLILLSSCVFLTENTLNQTVNDDSFLNRFPENEKAIVILKFNGKKDDKIYLCEQENFSKDNKNCLKIFASNQYKILMLKPQLYHLAFKNDNQPIFSKQKEPKQQYLAVLPIKAGEIIYAGDIFYKKTYQIDDQESLEPPEIKVRDGFAVNDNFELLQNLLLENNPQKTAKLFANQMWEVNFLIKKYPLWQNRLSTRLIKEVNLKSKTSPQLKQPSKQDLEEND